MTTEHDQLCRQSVTIRARSVLLEFVPWWVGEHVNYQRREPRDLLTRFLLEWIDVSLQSFGNASGNILSRSRCSLLRTTHHLSDSSSPLLSCDCPCNPSWKPHTCLDVLCVDVPPAARDLIFPSQLWMRVKSRADFVLPQNRRSKRFGSPSRKGPGTVDGIVTIRTFSLVLLRTWPKFFVWGKVSFVAHVGDVWMPTTTSVGKRCLLMAVKLRPRMHHDFSTTLGSFVAFANPLCSMATASTAQ